MTSSYCLEYEALFQWESIECNPKDKEIKAQNQPQIHPYTKDKDHIT